MDLTTGLLLAVFALVGGLVYLSFKCSALEVKAAEANQAALRAYKKAQDEAQQWAEAQAQTLLREWVLRKEKEIRADAIVRSKAVVKGKVVEQLIPFTEDFDYEPRDLRFLGAPCDLIAFDGLTKGTLRRIVFLEVKTGKTGRLSKREQQIKQVIEARKVEFELVHRR